jgi:hypothetical protein
MNKLDYIQMKRNGLWSLIDINTGLIVRKSKIKFSGIKEKSKPKN